MSSKIEELKRRIASLQEELAVLEKDQQSAKTSKKDVEPKKDLDTLEKLIACKNITKVVEYLKWTSDEDRTSLVNMLLEKNEWGHTCVHMCIMYNSSDEFKGIAIEEFKAIENVFSSQTDYISWLELLREKNNHGMTWVHLCAEYNSIEIFREIVSIFMGRVRPKSDEVPIQQDHFGRDDYDSLLKLLKEKDIHGHTWIHWCCRYNSAKIFREIVDIFGGIVRLQSDEDSMVIQQYHFDLDDRTSLIDLFQEKDDGGWTCVYECVNCGAGEVFVEIFDIWLSEDEPGLIKHIKTHRNIKEFAEKLDLITIKVQEIITINR